MRFAKGHGTGNDFVILPDPDGELNVTPELVAAICDRHFGLGADGLLRVVHVAAVESAADARPAEWFMDYRNADGSTAEMCGNGVRVFVRYLIEEGLASGPDVAVVTRAGIKLVRAEADGQFTVDMGGAVVLGDGVAEAGGKKLPGLAISVGNPHVACLVDQPVADIDLSAPRVLMPDELAAGGANIEVVRIAGEREVEMRVHERGSGLTLSCGTGAVAAAVAAAVSAGEWPASECAWTVRVPGGKLAVTPSATASLLSGPAVIVARGVLAADWLARQAGAAPRLALLSTG